jgi:hypothetical protein
MPMRRIAPLALIALTVFLTSCGPLELASLGKNSAIAVDGKVDDWQGALYAIADQPVLVGVRNDAEAVYVCLQVADPRTISPVVRRGFIVWFDPSGGTGRVLGIKFPVGMNMEMGEVNPEGPRERADRGQPGQPPVMDRTQVEILGPQKGGVQRLKKDDLKGLEVALDNRNGFFIYELKIPLVKGPDAPVALGSAPGKVIGITFETPGVDRDMPGRDGAMMPGGGLGGYGGRGRMGGYGGYGDEGGLAGSERGRNASGGTGEPIDLALKVTLARQGS